MAVNQMPPVEFVQALRMANKDIQDGDIVAAYQEARAANPNIDNMDSMELAKIAHAAAKQHFATPRAPAPVNTQLRSPYAGTTQEARNPMNPAASGQSQFDPEAVKAAQEAQSAGYRASLPMRRQAAFWGSQGTAAGDAATNLLKASDEQLARETLGKQALLQAQATAGTANATANQNMSKTAGEYDASQQKSQEDINQARQKTAVGAFSLATQQRLNDPNAAEAILAKSMLANQIAMDPALANNAELQNLLKRKDLTAQMIMGFMDPNVLDAYKKKIGIVEEESKARISQAVSNEFTGGARPTMPSTNTAPASAPNATMPSGNKGAGPLGWNGNPNNPNDTSKLSNEDKIAILQGQLSAATSPSDRAAIQSEISMLQSAKPQATSAGAPQGTPQLTQAGKDRAQYSTITGGGQTLVPNPVVVAKGAQAGKQAGDFADSMKVYKTTIEPYIDATLDKLATTMAGKGTLAIAQWMPASEQQELANLLAQVNNTYPSALPADLAARITAAQAKGGFTGSMVSGMTNEQLTRALKLIKANQQRGADYERTSQSKQPGEFAKEQNATGTKSSNTVEMTKGGKTFDIPADKVEAARARGYK